jgi:hypothetical protein
MPKPRPEKKVDCSFCGQHKDDVPLMVSSAKNVNICAWCALAVVEQTFGAMVQMEQMIKQAVRPAPEGDPPAMPDGLGHVERPPKPEKGKENASGS